MCLLSQLAYEPLDEESDQSWLTLAKDLAELAGIDQISRRLTEIAKGMRASTGSKNTAGEYANKLLAELLDMGGFELAGTLFSDKTGTQGFVACHPPSPVHSAGMVVVAFRGTQQKEDWLTNLNAEKTEAYHPSEPGKLAGHVHRGFNNAYLSVKPQLDSLLASCRANAPIYFTGHSLGGALATLATWYSPALRNAACYTYGAPRAGDPALNQHYRTPVYRIVNGGDPVPMVPPSGWVKDVAKFVLRLLPLPYLNHAVSWVINRQGYRHFGDQRYLSIAQETVQGEFPGLKMQMNLTGLERYLSILKRYIRGGATFGARFDRYHDIGLYRRKLRYIVHLRSLK